MSSHGGLQPTFVSRAEENPVLSYSPSKKVSIGYHSRVTFMPDSIRMTIMPAFQPDGSKTWYSRKGSDVSREFNLSGAAYFLQPRGTDESSVLTMRVPGSNGRLDAPDRLAAQFLGHPLPVNRGWDSSAIAQNFYNKRGSLRPVQVCSEDQVSRIWEKALCKEAIERMRRKDAAKASDDDLASMLSGLSVNDKSGGKGTDALLADAISGLSM